MEKTKQNIKTEKFIRKMVVKNLNRSYSAMYKISRKWKTPTLPLITIRETLNKTKLDTNTDHASVNIHNKKFNNMVDSIYNTCRQKAKLMNTEHVTISYIKECFDVCIESYKQTQV